MTASPRRGAERATFRDRPAAAAAQPKRAAVLSAAQVQQLMDAAGPRDRALIALLVAGAMRIGEATLLAWPDMADGVVTVPAGVTKTRKSRNFTLPQAALDAVLAWKEQCPQSQAQWMFPGRPVRNPLGVRRAQAAIQEVAAACGLKGVSSHSFRRSTLTAAAESGLSLRACAEISGHSSLAALERYLDAGASRAAAEEARGLLFQA